MVRMCAGRKTGRVIVLGSDGMDPKILEPLLKAGRMPNFTKVLERGFYSRMSTTNPAESPVAWSSFATGCNPGKHGIFDFLHRDPATYRPKIAAVTVIPHKNRKPEVIGNRKGVFTRQRQPKLAAHMLKKRWRAKPSFT